MNNLNQALKESKGPGNFRNLFVYASKGKKDVLQLIPVSEVIAKNEFFNIKNVTRDELLAAHRVPPQLLGIVPHNADEFGDVEKARIAFSELEIKSLQTHFTVLNKWLNQKIISSQTIKTLARIEK